MLFDENVRKTFIYVILFSCQYWRALPHNRKYCEIIFPFSCTVRQILNYFLLHAIIVLRRLFTNYNIYHGFIQCKGVIQMKRMIVLVLSFLLAFPALPVLAEDASDTSGIKDIIAAFSQGAQNLADDAGTAVTEDASAFIQNLISTFTEDAQSLVEDAQALAEDTKTTITEEAPALIQQFINTFTEDAQALIDDAGTAVTEEAPTLIQDLITTFTEEIQNLKQDTDTPTGAFDAAFEADALVLTEVQMPEILPEEFEFPEELWEMASIEKPEDPYADVEQFLPYSEIVWLSLSPAGNSGFLTVDDSTVAYYNGKYRILYPDLAHSVTDEYGKFEKYYQQAMIQILRLLGREGIIYSPDGRYAAITNIDQTLIYMNMFIDPILIDLSTGAILLTDTFSQKFMDEKAGSMATACFSADNRYFYYYIYGNIGETRSALFRYDLETGETESCYSGTDLLYYPRLSETADGDLIILKDTYNGSQGVVKLTCSQDSWSAEEHSFDLSTQYWYTNQMLYSAASGYAVASGRSMGLAQSNYAVQCIRIDEDFAGLNRYLAISKEDDQLLTLSAEEIQETLDGLKEAGEDNTLQFPYQLILSTRLSPDGQYMLLHTQNTGTLGNPNRIFHLYVVRLEDLAIREVTGLDPASIPFDILASYKPMIEWNTDTLIIGTDNGIRTYSFR